MQMIHHHLPSGRKMYPCYIASKLFPLSLRFIIPTLVLHVPVDNYDEKWKSEVKYNHLNVLLMCPLHPTYNLTRLHQGPSYSLGRWFFRHERRFTPGTKEIEK